MDWTSTLGEDGHDDLIIPPLLLERRASAPRLARLVSHLYHHRSPSDDSSLSSRETNGDGVVGGTGMEQEVAGAHTLVHHLVERASADHSKTEYSTRYTLWSMYFLSINYILGVGVLGIPYAFAKAGFILCLGLLFFVTIFSYMTVMWVAETGARYEEQIVDSKNEIRASSQCEASPLVMSNGSGPRADYSRYEVIDLVEHYLGSFHKGLYQVSLMALMYIGLLAYSQVFCGALSALLWTHGGSSSITVLPQIIFGLMVVPLSCIELEEQVCIQSVMSTVRFVAIFIIAFGSLVALVLDDSRSTRDHPPYFAEAHPGNCDMSYTSCFSGFGVAFSTCLFSQLFQHSIPGLLRPLREQPTRLSQVPKVLGGSLLTTATFYMLIGTLAASFFGADTRSSINLNFTSFIFGVNQKAVSPFAVAWLRFFSGIVVLFPALDTISVYPLIANTLGSNLLSSTGGQGIRILTPCTVRLRNWNEGGLSGRITWCCSDDIYDTLTMNEKRDVLKQTARGASILFRLVAALPPLVGSIVATDLSFSLQLAGIAGIHVAFIAPSLMHIQSSRLNGTNSKNVYSGWYSSQYLCIPVLVFATFSLCMSVLQIWTAISHGNY